MVGIGNSSNIKAKAGAGIGRGRSMGMSKGGGDADMDVDMDMDKADLPSPSSISTSTSISPPHPLPSSTQRNISPHSTQLSQLAQLSPSHNAHDSPHSPHQPPPSLTTAIPTQVELQAETEVPPIQAQPQSQTQLLSSDIIVGEEERDSQEEEGRALTLNDAIHMPLQPNAPTGMSAIASSPLAGGGSIGMSMGVTGTGSGTAIMPEGGKGKRRRSSQMSASTGTGSAISPTRTTTSQSKTRQPSTSTSTSNSNSNSNIYPFQQHQPYYIPPNPIPSPSTTTTTTTTRHILPGIPLAPPIALGPAPPSFSAPNAIYGGYSVANVGGEGMGLDMGVGMGGMQETEAEMRWREYVRASGLDLSRFTVAIPAPASGSAPVQGPGAGAGGVNGMNQQEGAEGQNMAQGSSPAISSPGMSFGQAQNAIASGSGSGNSITGSGRRDSMGMETVSHRSGSFSGSVGGGGGMYSPRMGEIREEGERERRGRRLSDSGSGLGEGGRSVSRGSGGASGGGSGKRAVKAEVDIQRLMSSIEITKKATLLKQRLGLASLKAPNGWSDLTLDQAESRLESSTATQTATSTPREREREMGSNSPSPSKQNSMRSGSQGSSVSPPKASVRFQPAEMSSSPLRDVPESPTLGMEQELIPLPSTPNMRKRKQMSSISLSSPGDLLALSLDSPEAKGVEGLRGRDMSTSSVRDEDENGNKMTPRKRMHSAQASPRTPGRTPPSVEDQALMRAFVLQHVFQSPGGGAAGSALETPSSPGFASPGVGESVTAKGRISTEMLAPLASLGRRMSHGVGPRLGFAIPKKIDIESLSPRAGSVNGEGRGAQSTGAMAGRGTMNGLLMERYGDLLGSKGSPAGGELGHRRRVSSASPFEFSGNRDVGGLGAPYNGAAGTLSPGMRRVMQKPRSASHSVADGRRPDRSRLSQTNEVDMDAEDAASVLTQMLGAGARARSPFTSPRPRDAGVSALRGKPYMRPFASASSPGHDDAGERDQDGFRIPRSNKPKKRSSSLAGIPPPPARSSGSPELQVLSPAIPNQEQLQKTPPKRMIRLPQRNGDDIGMAGTGGESSDEDRRAAELMIFLAQSPSAGASKVAKKQLFGGPPLGRILFEDGHAVKDSSSALEVGSSPLRASFEDSPEDTEMEDVSTRPSAVTSMEVD